MVVEAARIHGNTKPDHTARGKAVDSITRSTTKLRKKLARDQRQTENQQGAGNGVAEAYSPPRMTALARKIGIRLGLALDTTACDETGRPWDFRHSAQRHTALELARREKPAF